MSRKNLDIPKNFNANGLLLIFLCSNYRVEVAFWRTPKIDSLNFSYYFMKKDFFDSRAILTTKHQNMSFSSFSKFWASKLEG